MISSLNKSSLQHSNLISCEIFKEFSGNNNFSSSLSITFRHSSLNYLGKVVFNFRFSHFSGNIEKNTTPINVSIGVFQRVEKSRFGTWSSGIQNILNLLSLNQRNSIKIFSIHRVDNRFCFIGINPLTIDQVPHFIRVGSRNCVRVNSGPTRDRSEVISRSNGKSFLNEFSNHFF